MIFSSPIFIFVFLPITLFVYYITPKNLKNYVLLVFSLLFYAWGEPIFVLIMLISIIMNYIFGLITDKVRNNKLAIRFVITIMLIFNLGLLIIFKYIPLFEEILNLGGRRAIDLPEFILPIGISFFTFQAITYVIDVYRKDAIVEKNPFNVALYISLFPQLIAGPIVRYKTIANQIYDRNRERWSKFNEGVKRFITGLAKKVIIADTFAIFTSEIIGVNPSEMSVLLAWIGILAFTFQLYFDFSGYSDMAIGLGKMFGFDFLENFNYPYIAQSVSDFWRRWNMSLGAFFRDYVYIPMGGNRKHIYINLLVVWLLTGIWHGASLTFVFWGLWFFALISLERLFLGKILKKIPAFFGWLYTFLAAVIGWVFFVSPDFAYALEYLQTMFGLNNVILYNNYDFYYIIPFMWVWIIGIFCSTPIFKKIRYHISNLSLVSFKNKVFYLAQELYFILLLIITISFLVASTYSPFLYFRF